MSARITFRCATMLDWALLLEWRNDSMTRYQSRNQGPVRAEDHLDWLHKVINADRGPWIAMVYNEPIGTVRVDQHELSWTVAPKHRAQHWGSKMLDAFMRSYPDTRYYAEIKEGNAASLRIAEANNIKIKVLA